MIVPVAQFGDLARRQALYDTFSLFGNILSCKVATDDAGESKGYGYVHYETGVSANMAITKINGMLIAGKQVRRILFFLLDDGHLFCTNSTIPSHLFQRRKSIVLPHMPD